MLSFRSIFFLIFLIKYTYQQILLNISYPNNQHNQLTYYNTPNELFAYLINNINYSMMINIIFPIGNYTFDANYTLNGNQTSSIIINSNTQCCVFWIFNTTNTQITINNFNQFALYNINIISYLPQSQSQSQQQWQSQSPLYINQINKFDIKNITLTFQTNSSYNTSQFGSFPILSANNIIKMVINNLIIYDSCKYCPYVNLQNISIILFSNLMINQPTYMNFSSTNITHVATNNTYFTINNNQQEQLQQQKGEEEEEEEEVNKPYIMINGFYLGYGNLNDEEYENGNDNDNEIINSNNVNTTTNNTNSSTYQLTESYFYIFSTILTISNYSNLILENFALSNVAYIITQPIFNLKNLGNVSINNFTTINSSINALKINNWIFYSSEINQLFYSNSQIINSNTSKINFLVIYNKLNTLSANISNLFYSQNDMEEHFCMFDIEGDVTDFHMTNVSLQQNLITNKFLKISLLKDDSLVTTTSPEYTYYINNITFYQNNLIAIGLIRIFYNFGSRFLTALNVFEKFTINFDNISIIANTFSKNGSIQYAYGCPFIDSSNFALKFSNITIQQNYFNFFNLARFPLNINTLYFRNSLITNNYFDNSILFLTLAGMPIFNKINPNFLNYTSSSIYPIYRMTVLENNIIQNSVFSNNSGIIQLNNAFYLNYNNTYQNLTFIDSYMERTGNFNPIKFTTLLTYYQRNYAFESSIFRNEDSLYEFFNSSYTLENLINGNITTKIQSQAVYFYRISSNTYLDIYIVISSSPSVDAIEISSYSFSQSFIMIDNNNFTNIQLNGILTNLFDVGNILNAYLIQNSINNVYSIGNILSIGLSHTFHVWLIYQNIIQNIQSTFFYGTYNAGLNFTISNNTISDIYSSATFYIQYVYNSTGILALTNNIFQNSFIATMPGIYDKFNFMSFEFLAIDTFNINPLVLHFTNNQFINLTLDKNISFCKTAYKNDLIYFDIGNYTLNMTKNHFYSNQLLKTGSLINIAANQTLLLDNLFINSRSYSDKAVLITVSTCNLTLYQNIFINNSQVYNFQPAKGLIYLAYDKNLMKSVYVNFKNNIFIENYGGLAGVIYFELSQVNLYSYQNYYINNFANSSYTIYIDSTSINATFLYDTIMFNNYNLTQRNFSNYEAGFFYITNSNGSLNIINPTPLCVSNINGTLFQIDQSPNLAFNATDLIVIGDNEDVQNQSPQYFKILQANSGYLNFKNINVSFLYNLTNPLFDIYLEDPAGFDLMNSNFSNITYQLQSSSFLGQLYTIRNNTLPLNKLEEEEEELTGEENEIYHYPYEINPTLFSFKGPNQININFSYVNFSDIFAPKGFSAKKTGIIITDYTTKKNTIIIDHCNFTRITSERGIVFSPIMLATKNVSVTNSLFDSNVANLSTPCLYIDYASLKLSNNTFISNYLNSSGGIIYSINHYSLRDLREKGNLFKNNLAVNGGHLFELASFALYVNMSLLNYQANTSTFTFEYLNKAIQMNTYNDSENIIISATPNIIKLNNVSSYDLAKAQFAFYLTDIYHHEVSDLKIDYDYVNVFFNNQTRQVSTANCSINGCYLINNPSFILSNLNGFVDNIIVQYYYIESYLIQNLTLNVNLRSCLPGEYNDTGTCNLCPNNTYSVDPSIDCESCPQNATCPGGSTIVPNSGFWRLGTTSTILECPNQDVCPGGTQPCITGYTGVTCLACDTEKMYMLSSDGICKKCDSLYNLFWIYGIKLVCNITFEFIFIMIIINSNINCIQWKKDPKTYPNLRSTIYFKLLINYSQIMSILLNLNHHSRDVNQIYLGFLGGPGIELFYNAFRCFLTYWGFSLDSLEALRLGILILAPFVKIILYAIILLLHHGMRAIKYFGIIFTCVMYIEQPSIFQEILSYFICTQVAGSAYFIADNPSVNCYTRDYWFAFNYFGLPGCLFYTSFPFIILFILYQNKSCLDSISLRTQFGLFLNGHHHKDYYWEVLYLFTINLISFTRSLLYLSFVNLGMTVMMIILIFYGIQYMRSPYDYPKLNYEARWINYSYICTIYSLIFIYGNDLNYANNIIQYATIIVNFVCFFFIVFNACQIYIENLLIKLFKKPSVRRFSQKRRLVSECLIGVIARTKNSELRGIVTNLNENPANLSFADTASKIEISLVNTTKNGQEFLTT